MKKSILYFQLESVLKRTSAFVISKAVIYRLEIKTLNNIIPMADGYDPQKSRVAEDTLADFLRAPLTGDLTEVPGIGKAAVTKLSEASEDGNEAVTNTFQLIGKFLMLKVRQTLGRRRNSRKKQLNATTYC